VGLSPPRVDVLNVVNGCGVVGIFVAEQDKSLGFLIASNCAMFISVLSLNKRYVNLKYLHNK